MFLSTAVIGCLCLVLLLVRCLTRRRIDLSHVPGPTYNPWWALVNNSHDNTRQHTLTRELARKYGPIFKLPMPTGNDHLVVCDFDSIYQISVKDGKTFGGRATLFRLTAISEGTGILTSAKPDATWKTLRKTTQRHLRQFGDGLSRLESIIVTIADDMFGDFEAQNANPYDPHDVIFDTALSSIAFLMIGKRTKSGDDVLEKMREFESMFLKTLGVLAPFSIRILDVFPFLRHFGWPSWRLFERLLKLEGEIWSSALAFANENPDAESICKVLMDRIAAGDPDLRERDAVKSTLMLLFAGVSTTSNTFYATINILAHNPHVQRNIHDEIRSVIGDSSSPVGLNQRPSMPYTRATLLEALRYISVVANGVMHETLTEGTIKGYRIPAGTAITPSLWTLHHDEALWKEPYSFDPSRFIGEDGDLVPADHPNRRHLMPFGAGTRVCLGESLAMTRLFLWITSLVQKFEVSPAQGNHKSSTDPRRFQYFTVLRPERYEVIFKRRE